MTETSGKSAEHLARELDSFLERKQRRLLWASGDRDDDAVEEPHTAAHHLLVAASDRIERAGIHGADFHVASSRDRFKTPHCSAPPPQTAKPSKPYSTVPAWLRLRHSPAFRSGNPAGSGRSTYTPSSATQAGRSSSRGSTGTAYGGSRNTTSKRCGAELAGTPPRPAEAIRGLAPNVSAWVERLDEPRVLLDEPRLGRAARQRLEAERAGARVEIEHARA